jgi:hypothetical protein
MQSNVLAVPPYFLCYCTMEGLELAAEKIFIREYMRLTFKNRGKIRPCIENFEQF